MYFQFTTDSGREYNIDYENIINFMMAGIAIRSGHLKEPLLMSTGYERTLLSLDEIEDAYRKGNAAYVKHVEELRSMLYEGGER